MVGDVVGAVGRAMVAKYVPLIKEKEQVDLVICNAENAAHGKGITRKIYNQLLSYGVDVITMGNHTFSKEVLLEFIDECEKMVRPKNMEPTEAGKSTIVVEVKGKKIAVSNLLGEVFMNNVTASPFDAMLEILEEYKEADFHIVDLHGEVTSEKVAFAYQFSDRVSIAVGTHTHVQTADERIVNGRCAAISDLGMCGPYDSVLGRDINEVLTRFMSHERTRYTIAEGRGIFCGCLVEIDEESNAAVSIQRIQIREDE